MWLKLTEKHVKKLNYFFPNEGPLFLSLLFLRIFSTQNQEKSKKDHHVRKYTIYHAKSSEEQKIGHHVLGQKSEHLV